MALITDADSKLASETIAKFIHEYRMSPVLVPENYLTVACNLLVRILPGAFAAARETADLAVGPLGPTGPAGVPTSRTDLLKPRE
jgi:hypothetical protein